MNGGDYNKIITFENELSMGLSYPTGIIELFINFGHKLHSKINEIRFGLRLYRFFRVISL